MSFPPKVDWAPAPMVAFTDFRLSLFRSFIHAAYLYCSVWSGITCRNYTNALTRDQPNDSIGLYLQYVLSATVEQVC